MAETQVTTTGTPGAGGTDEGVDAPDAATTDATGGKSRTRFLSRSKRAADDDRPAPAPDAARAPVKAERARPARTITGRRRVRARRVRRTIRHVDPWSVFKVGIVFCLCMYGALLLAVSLLWRAALSTGLLDNIESFLVEIGLFDSFEFKGDVMFRAVAVGGLVLAVAAAALLVLMTVVFNLISDLMGGIRVSVIEEDVAYLRDPDAVDAASRNGQSGRPAPNL